MNVGSVPLAYAAPDGLHVGEAPKPNMADQTRARHTLLSPEH